MKKISWNLFATILVYVFLALCVGLGVCIVIEHNNRTQAREQVDFEHTVVDEYSELPTIPFDSLVDEQFCNIRVKNTHIGDTVWVNEAMYRVVK